jgi:hypothetical protein
MRKERRKKEEEKNKEKKWKKTCTDDNMHSWYQLEFHKNSFYDHFIIIISIG